MILSASKCGCPIRESPRFSQTSLSRSNSSNLNCHSSRSSFNSISDTSSCGCGSDCESTEEVKQPSVVSEIAKKGLPYEEIEAIINNNRMVLRIQKEAPKPEFEPPCDCIEPDRKESGDVQERSENQRNSNNITFQKANPGCHTISVYPHPDKKKPEDKRPTPGLEKSKKGDSKNVELKKPVVFPTVNPEENPNIFVLKIKRKRDSGENKHNLDLEFKTPRPWRKKPQELKKRKECTVDDKS